MLIVAVCVDDIILGGKKSGKSKCSQRETEGNFEMKDLGPLHHF